MITEEDLACLVENKVLERKTLEYKRRLPSDTDEERLKFLATVSSFANASGGDLVFGISEDRETGVPERLEGLDVENIDKEILRLENMVRDGIRPRLTYFGSRPVKLSNTKWVLIIRVQRSWRSPHRLTFKGNDKFYSRGTNGKYQMDVDELRAAFTLSETVVERTRRFREDRISKIVADETPVVIGGSARVVLHLVPIASFNPGQEYGVGYAFEHPASMRPMRCGGWNHMYNFDGVLTYCASEARGTRSYVQLFRSGMIEAVEGTLLEPERDSLIIPGGALENVLIESLGDYLKILEKLQVPPPIFLFVTLLHVKGYSMSAHATSYDSIDSLSKVDRDILLLPEVMIDGYGEDNEVALRPCCDAIWNACGYPGSPRYAKLGKKL